MAARFTGNALKSAGECRGGSGEEWSGSGRDGNEKNLGRQGCGRGRPTAQRRRTNGRYRNRVRTDIPILQASSDPLSSLPESLPLQGEEQEF